MAVGNLPRLNIIHHNGSRLLFVFPLVKSFTGQCLVAVGKLKVGGRVYIDLNLEGGHNIVE